MTLNELAARLDPERFQVVNLDAVAQMQSNEDRRLRITLCDGSEIVASRSASEALRRLVR